MEPCPSQSQGSPAHNGTSSQRSAGERPDGRDNLSETNGCLIGGDPEELPGGTAAPKSRHLRFRHWLFVDDSGEFVCPGLSNGLVH